MPIQTPVQPRVQVQVQPRVQVQVPEGVPVPEVPRVPVQPSVYLLHFTTPVAHSAHYLGVADQPIERAIVLKASDASGRNTNLLKALHKIGGAYAYIIADVWDVPTMRAARDLLYKFQQQGSRRRLCSICNPGNGRGLGRGNGRKVPA